jgi:hypothetical protein
MLGVGCACVCALAGLSPAKSSSKALKPLIRR